MEIPADVCESGHKLAPGSTPITLTRIDDKGKAHKEQKLLRNHLALVPGQYQNEQLTLTERSTWGWGGPPEGSVIEIQVPAEPALTVDEICPFDPTGLVPAVCEHGLPDHPDPRINSKRYGAGSWIRGKYVGFEGNSRKVVCPVCLGQEEPADMKVAANATPLPAQVPQTEIEPDPMDQW